MKKLNLNIVAAILAVLAIFGLVKGQVVLFLGLLFLSGMILGANRMMNLEEQDPKDSIKSIKKSNIKLALLGLVFGVLSNTGIQVVDLLASFFFGTCFGLIAVNFMFEKSNKN